MLSNETKALLIQVDEENNTAFKGNFKDLTSESTGILDPFRMVSYPYKMLLVNNTFVYLLVKVNMVVL